MIRISDHQIILLCQKTNLIARLVLYDKLLLRYEYFCRYTHSLDGIMSCHGNHAISHNQNEFYFGGQYFLHLSGPIEHIGMHKKLP